MTTGWRYRLASILGTALFVVLAIALVNEPAIQDAFSAIPYFGRPAPEVLSDGDLLLAISTALVVTLGAMWPLFKPQPRRILDTILETQRRVILAMIGLAALGYFNYTYRLPRSTVMLSTAILLFVLPLFMVSIRRQPTSTKRALVVGDDPEAMRLAIDTSDSTVLGYVAPSSIDESALRNAVDESVRVSGRDGPSGAIEIERLGGLSRIEDVIRANDIDTVVLGFSSPDRAEFFGTLATCYEHGIRAKIHKDHARSVLTAQSIEGALVDVVLEPWDLQDRLLKRLFDVGFATLALTLLAPVMLLIALAIKLDDGGPVLFSQERTATFGDTFTMYKFRTMRPGGASARPGDEADRITRVGKLLRRTHLDEIPQLWVIFTGQMSVVGPRATWTDEETYLENVASTWRQRWFVKPGLTGLAQINGATSTEPEVKLMYDLQYIREQSLWIDLQIVLRQFWHVSGDVREYLTGVGKTRRDDTYGGDGGTRKPNISGPSEGVGGEEATVNDESGPPGTPEPLHGSPIDRRDSATEKPEMPSEPVTDPDHPPTESVETHR